MVITVKRPFLLLEVMIAFMLVMMCIIPLIAPHSFILLQQKKFIQKIEVDHLVNLAYADIVERLYRGDISWGQITTGTETEIDNFHLERMGFNKKLPYKGTYRFEEIRHKPLDDSPRKLYLFELQMKFVPRTKEVLGLDEEPEGTLNYTYELFLVRDLNG